MSPVFGIAVQKISEGGQLMRVELQAKFPICDVSESFEGIQACLSTQPVVLPQRKANLGELAVQETINQFSLQQPPQTAVFLFEDHSIARASFFLPEHCQNISTRAFLIFLEQKGWIASASAIERLAIQAGRALSQLRFPPD